MNALMRGGAYACREVLYGGHLQSAGAALLVYAASMLLRISPTWDILVLAYLLFYSFYIFNRFAEAHTDEATNPGRTRHILSYRNRMPFLLAGVVLAVLALAFRFAAPGGAVFIVLLLVLGLLYTRGGKQITMFVPLFKNAYVASFFGLLFLLPSLYYGLSFSAHQIFFAGFVFLKMAGVQALLDIKDEPSDRNAGLKTLPVLVGPERARTSILWYGGAVSAAAILFFPLLAGSFAFTLAADALVRRRMYAGYMVASSEVLAWPILILAGT